jgi:hypothetical protein
MASTVQTARSGCLTTKLVELRLERWQAGLSATRKTRTATPTDRALSCSSGDSDFITPPFNVGQALWVQDARH